jgi:hypothetical protein
MVPMSLSEAKFPTSIVSKQVENREERRVGYEILTPSDILEIEKIGTQISYKLRLFFEFSKEEFETYIFLLAQLDNLNTNGIYQARAFIDKEKLMARTDGQQNLPMLPDPDNRVHLPYLDLWEKRVKPQCKALASIIQEKIDVSRPNEGWKVEVVRGALAGDMMHIFIVKVIPGIRKVDWPMICLYAPKSASDTYEDQIYCGFSIEFGMKDDLEDPFVIFWNNFPGGTHVELYSKLVEGSGLAPITRILKESGVSQGGPIERVITHKSRRGEMPTVSEMLKPREDMNTYACYDVDTGKLLYIKIYIKMPEGTSQLFKEAYPDKWEKRRGFALRDTAFIVYDYRHTTPTTGDIPSSIQWEGDLDTNQLVKMGFPLPQIEVVDDAVRIHYHDITDIHPLTSEGPVVLAQRVADKVKDLFHNLVHQV